MVGGHAQRTSGSRLDRSGPALLQAQQQAAARPQVATESLLQLRNEKASVPDAGAVAERRNDQLIQRLTAIDGNVRAALQQRTSATAEIDAAIAAIEARGARSCRRSAAKATAVVEERQKALLAAEEATRQRLEQTPAYQQQLQAAQRAEQIAVGAEQKTQAGGERPDSRRASRTSRTSCSSTSGSAATAPPRTRPVRSPG